MGASEPDDGVIKYRLRWRRRRLPRTVRIAPVERWRAPLWRMKLLGQSPARYSGLGYGNISCRLARHTRRFIVTGTQTGGRVHLKRHDYSVVLRALPHQGVLWAVGETAPSSEALTHAIVYQTLRSVGGVVHVHSPEIWNARQELGLASTPDHVPYGSIGMAEAVARIARAHPSEGILAMGGHRDGILAWGRTLEDATMLVLRIWARACITSL